MDRRLFLRSLLLSSIALSASPLKLRSTTKEEKFEKIISKIKNLNTANLPINDLVAICAHSFLGVPYGGGSLDVDNAKEELRYTLDSLDCVTFVETTLALSLICKRNSSSLKDFEKELTRIRYKSGEIIDYSSRLHYTSEWIRDNVQKGILIALTKQLGGDSPVGKVNFMSENPSLYKALKNDEIMRQKIKENEKLINSNPVFYIPKSKVSDIENKIESGYVICIAASKKGLDYSHLGFAYRDAGKVRLLHASSAQKKVILDESISAYLSKHDSAIGISVLKPII
jgi:hypothetical protein